MTPAEVKNTLASKGLCGEVQDGRACLLPLHHGGGHGWQPEPACPPEELRSRILNYFMTLVSRSRIERDAGEVVSRLEDMRALRDVLATFLPADAPVEWAMEPW